MKTSKPCKALCSISRHWTSTDKKTIYQYDPVLFPISLMLLWISFADVSLKFLKGHWIRWEAADATHAFSSPINGSVHQLVLRHDHETIEWDSRFQRSNDFDAIMTSDQCHESPRPKLWGFGKTHIPRWLTSARGWFLEMLTQVGIKRNSLVGVGWRTVVQWFSYIFTFFFNESNWNLKSRRQDKLSRNSGTVSPRESFRTHLLYKRQDAWLQWWFAGFPTIKRSHKVMNKTITRCLQSPSGSRSVTAGELCWQALIPSKLLRPRVSWCYMGTAEIHWDSSRDMTSVTSGFYPNPFFLPASGSSLAGGTWSP